MTVVETTQRPCSIASTVPTIALDTCCLREISKVVASQMQAGRAHEHDDSKAGGIVVSAVADRERAGPDLSILVKAFNEAPSLATVVSELQDAFATTSWAYEIIIVNDGSHDRTGEIAEELAKRDPRVRVIHHPRNRGIGE